MTITISGPPFNGPNRIALRRKSEIIFREAFVDATFTVYPGMILETTTNTSGGSVTGSTKTPKVKPHATYGGRVGEKLIAIENPWGTGFNSQTIATAYAAGDLCFHDVSEPGEEYYLLVGAGVNATLGALLISAGDGTLTTAPNVTNTDGGPVVYQTVAASSNLTNSTVETAFSTGSFSFPANSLKAGDVIRIRAQVDAPTTNSTDTLTLKVKIGSTVLLATAAVDVANGDTGLLDVELVVRSIGATGSIVANGNWTLGVPGTATSRAVTLGATTLDTTAAAAITVTGTWSVASASDICALTSMTVELQRGVYPFAKVLVAYDNTSGTDPIWVQCRIV
jgi:hypothetical protein